MQAFLTDENFKLPIVLALRRAVPSVDITSIDEYGLRGADDPAVLAAAANLGRVLLTHDNGTMSAAANSRLLDGAPMPGVVVVPWTLPLGRAIDDLVTAIECSQDDEWENQIRFLPL
jgi:predicted nuclease of predicted toxin-antitoxin system